ncbi:MAG: T9SS type A sorting domain-containing protein [Ignavibacteriae bacterium]|nr:T9SS type A sorting domain-containing protein [Ignavibacteriota bacterium]
MKSIFTIIFIVVFSVSSFSQQWNKVWTMQQMPFQPEDITSEMTKVLAGLDTDEDGFGEFLCGNSDLEKNHILMYEATGDNSYELVWSYEYPVAGTGWFGVAVGDIDNNGKVDIVLGWPSDVNAGDVNPPRIFTFEWSGVTGENIYGKKNTDGTFRATHQTNFDLPDNMEWNPYSMIIEDIDKDNVNELIIGIRSGGREREVLVASVSGGTLSGFGKYVIEYNYQNLEGGSNYCTAIGDLDNDGNTDIFEMVWNMFTLRMFEVTGPNQYEHVNDLEQIYADEEIDYGALDGLKIDDINGDGKNELFIAGTEDANTVFIIQNISDISQITENDIVELTHIPTKIKPDGSLTLGQFRNMVIGDPDQDGLKSLIIAGEQNGQIFDLEYKGSGDLADENNWNLTVAYDVFEDALAEVVDTVAAKLTPRLYYGSLANDMDGDGLSEYVFTNYSNDRSIWANDPYVTILESAKTTDIILADNLIPEKFELSQNYPNPFNPTTKIRYSIPINLTYRQAGEKLETANVKIVIFNILGKEIATLVNQKQNHGNYEVTFDASKLNSGIYFYKLISGNFIETKKMIFLK